MVESLYIHIPFCLKKCVYCDFISIPFDKALSKRYVDALIKEMSLAGGRANRFRLKTVFIGGGTPTALRSGEIERFLAALGENFRLRPDCEFTAEANPATLDGEKLDVLIEGGVNRISIGAQSFEKDELKLLGRAHRPEDITDAVRLARRAGFENIGLDLIYGIPGQTMEAWRRNLKRALELGPTHISAYELTVEPRTGLMDLVKSGALSMPPDDEVLLMCRTAREVLEEAGLVRYEVSNYALPGSECRHNLNYWRRGEYLGLGAAAHSFSGVPPRRWRNTDSVPDYICRLESNALPVAGTETLSAEDEKRELVLLGLRTKDGVSISKAKRMGFQIEPAAGELIGEGLLRIEADRLFATGRGLELLNSVIFRLLEGI